MREVILDGTTMQTMPECLEQIFNGLAGLIPDPGGRNLDALHEDLLELSEPVVIRWVNSDAARQELFSMVDRTVDMLRSQSNRDNPITLFLE